MIKETIICSAIHYNDGILHKEQPINISIGLVVCGRRHRDCHNIFELLGIIIEGRIGSGFLTNYNRFVDRAEGYKIAHDANQLLLPHSENGMHILTSEDLFIDLED
jgi:hypothetical protein